MKTIRNNVFETNSSSTHSITIGPVVPPVDNNIEPLVENNVLYPSRLVQRQQEVDLGYDTLTSTTCSTKDEKAAVVVHWLHYSYYEYEEMTLEQYMEALAIIKNACGYDDIALEMDSDYYPYDEDSNKLNEFSLDELIEFILDNNIKIMDQTIPH